MGTNEFYYNRGKKITKEEAHALQDKSGLVVADREVDFSKEFKGTRRGLEKDYDPELDDEA